jgi:hypothetical protein
MLIPSLILHVSILKKEFISGSALIITKIKRPSLKDSLFIKLTG